MQFDKVRTSQKCINKLCELKRRLALVKKDSDAIVTGSVTDEMLSGFSQKLGDDLNISGALGELFTWVNDMFSRLDSDEINYDISRQALSALRKVDEVLGVMEEADQVETDDEIQGLIDRRNQARAEKDWDTADVIRKQLDELGIILEDTSEGTIWKKK